MSSLFFPSTSSPSSIGSIEVDILVEQAYNLSNQVTQHPVESGFIISDHAIRRPITSSMVVGITLSPITWLDDLGSSADKISTALEAFKSIYENGTTITIVTPTDVWENMVMVSANIPRKVETGNLVQIPCTFTQVTTVDIKTIDIPTDIVASSIEESAGETKTDVGNAATTDINEKTGDVDTAEKTEKIRTSLLSSIVNGDW